MNVTEAAVTLMQLGSTAVGQRILPLLKQFSQNERAAGGLAMAMARKQGVMRMRIEYKPDQDSYVVHDLSDNAVYYLSVEHVPEWARDSMALLSLVDPESTVDGVGFFYAPGVFYIDIKSAIPEEHRRSL